jgi:hypothetical protein
VYFSSSKIRKSVPKIQNQNVVQRKIKLLPFLGYGKSTVFCLVRSLHSGKTKRNVATLQVKAVEQGKRRLSVFQISKKRFRDDPGKSRLTALHAVAVSIVAPLLLAASGCDYEKRTSE